MIRIVPSTLDHLDTVLGDLSEQTLADMNAIGLTPEAARERFGRDLAGSDAYSAVEDDVVLAVQGWDKSPGVWYSWLLATAAFYDPERIAPVLASRRHLRRTAAENPDVSLVMLPCIPVHEKMTKWMKTLGYLYLPSTGIFVYKHSRA